MLVSILRKIYSFLIDTLETILLLGAIFLVTYVFLFKHFTVNGDSMYPNFENGEYVLTNIIGYQPFSFDFAKPRRGNVIVFNFPTDSDKDFIKRNIGAPRD